MAKRAFVEVDATSNAFVSTSNGIGSLPDKKNTSSLAHKEEIVVITNPKRVLITELNDNDVLQGRGSGSMQNTGNIRFRTLVEELRPSYVATSSRKAKAKMIGDMVQFIKSRKGRFLQRLCDSEYVKADVLRSDISSNAHGYGHGAILHEHEHAHAHGQHAHLYADREQYVEMADEEAAEKTKQAIRYVHYKKVPLEKERRKKRSGDTYPSRQGDNNFFGTSMQCQDSNEKTTDVANAHPGVEYGVGGNGENNMVIPTTTAAAQVPVPYRSSYANGAPPPMSIPGINRNAVSPQLQAQQQNDLGQLLATLQSTQKALGPQISGPTSALSQVPVQQSPVQQAAVAAGIVPALGLGNLQQQQQPSANDNANVNAMQLASSGPSLFSNNKSNNNSHLSQKLATPASTHLLNTAAGIQNHNQQQPQMNAMLQNVLQQQPHSLSNSIFRTLLQQQQQQHQQQRQQHWDSAMQSLHQQQQEQQQQQHQLASAIQSLQDNSAQEFHQQKANSILATILSNANANTKTNINTTSPQANPMLASLITQPPSSSMPSSTKRTPQTTMDAANSLLTSLFVNNMPRASPLHKTTNIQSSGTGTAHQLVAGLRDYTTGQQQRRQQHHQHQQQHQPQQGLRGENILQGIPGLGNASAILAFNTNANSATTNNNDQGQDITNTAKRSRPSLGSIGDYRG